MLMTSGDGSGNSNDGALRLVKSRLAMEFGLRQSIHPGLLKITSDFAGVESTGLGALHHQNVNSASDWIDPSFGAPCSTNSIDSDDVSGSAMNIFAF
jgi:hypothetical protein